MLDRSRSLPPQQHVVLGRRAAVNVLFLVAVATLYLAVWWADRQWPGTAGTLGLVMTVCAAVAVAAGTATLVRHFADYRSSRRAARAAGTAGGFGEGSTDGR